MAGLGDGEGGSVCVTTGELRHLVDMGPGLGVPGGCMDPSMHPSMLAALAPGGHIHHAGTTSMRAQNSPCTPLAQFVGDGKGNGTGAGAWVRGGSSYGEVGAEVGVGSQGVQRASRPGSTSPTGGRMSPSLLAATRAATEAGVLMTRVSNSDLPSTSSELGITQQLMAGSGHLASGYQSQPQGSNSPKSLGRSQAQSDEMSGPDVVGCAGSVGAPSLGLGLGWGPGGGTGKGSMRSASQSQIYQSSLYSRAQSGNMSPPGQASAHASSHYVTSADNFAPSPTKRGHGSGKLGDNSGTVHGNGGGTTTNRSSLMDSNPTSHNQTSSNHTGASLQYRQMYNTSTSSGVTLPMSSDSSLYRIPWVEQYIGAAGQHIIPTTGRFQLRLCLPAHGLPVQAWLIQGSKASCAVMCGQTWCASLRAHE